MLLLPAFAFGKEPGKPLTIDTIQVLKVAGQDGRAVIKTPDGKMRIIKVGDPIGDHAKVTEITADRVIIEETKGKEAEKVLFRFENGKQRVERVKKTGEAQPPAYSANISQEPPAQGSKVREKRSTAWKKVKKAEKQTKKKKGKEENKDKKNQKKNTNEVK
jgi:Tfp pilus assembly protein PilP